MNRYLRDQKIWKIYIINENKSESTHSFYSSVAVTFIFKASKKLSLSKHSTSHKQGKQRRNTKQEDSHPGQEVGLGDEHCYQLRLKVIARQTLPAASAIEKAIASRRGAEKSTQEPGKVKEMGKIRKQKYKSKIKTNL